MNNLDVFENLEKYFKNKKSELLKRKGVYPYDYMNSFNKLNEIKLPPFEEFYSKLNDENISEEDYNHAKNIWNENNEKLSRFIS